MLIQAFEAPFFFWIGVKVRQKFVHEIDGGKSVKEIEPTPLKRAMPVLS